MIREEMMKYEQITGKSAEHIPIVKIGAFLDGYDAAKQEPYEKFKSTKDHIYKLAGDYKCWDNRLTHDEALELCHILEEQENPNSIRINFVGKEEAKEFKEYLKNQQESILDKIITEIEKQDKWLAQAGYNAYNVDIAFNSIKRVIAESEDK